MDRRFDASRLRLVATVTTLALLPAISPLAGAVRAASPAITFGAEADATVIKAKPDQNFGTTKTLEPDGSPAKRAYLRFNVTSLPAPVQRATLRVMVIDKSKEGPAVFATGSDWSETAIAWSSRPALAGGAVAESGSVSAGEWVELDVTPLVRGNGKVALALVNQSDDGADFASREAAADQPQLVVETATATSGPSTTTTAKPTTTTARPTTTTARPTTTTTRGDLDQDCDEDGWKDGELIGQLPHERGEMSGLTASHRWNNWAWGIRDSGNPASVYSVRPHLSGLADSEEFPVPGARNSDWEDVTWMPGPDGQGELWVMENMGNSYTGIRRFYRVVEPDPTGNLLDDILGDLAPRDTELIGRYDWAYPDQQYNTEAVFVFDGRLAVISKTSPSRVYLFTEPFSSSRLNVPEYIGDLPAGANLSIAAATPGGQYLAVGSHNRVYMYENRGDRDSLADLIADPPIWHQTLPDDNREGGGFFEHDSCDLVLVAESKNIWKIEER